MKKTYRSRVLKTVHVSMEDAFAVGAIDKKTMRRFDQSCLMPVVPVAPDEIRALRDREEVSQSVFARHLNVTPGLVSQWERGEKKPSGPSLKLLDLVQRKGLESII
jgi:putative transcriptional regulator